MPSITGGVGVCHTYVDSKIDTELALSVLDNAKLKTLLFVTQWIQY